MQLFQRSSWAAGTIRQQAWRIVAGLGTMAFVVLGAVTPANAVPFAELNARFHTPDTENGPGLDVDQAGSHPDVTFRFRLPGKTGGGENDAPVERPHRLQLRLPEGLIGNPQAVPACPEDLLKAGTNGIFAQCPAETQVGLVDVLNVDGSSSQGLLPLYSVEAPNDAPGQFAFNVIGAIIRLIPGVDPGSYAVVLDSGTISQAVAVGGIAATMWGVPADPVHDYQRSQPSGGWTSSPASSGAPRNAFLSLPTQCNGPAVFTASLDGWDSKGFPDRQSFWQAPNSLDLDVTGCDRLDFRPTIDVSPTLARVDAPSGLEVSLKVPQASDPNGLATAHVKDVKMLLPDGMSVSPSSARGLGACSPAEIGLGTDADPSCPRSSKLGTVTVETPLLAEPMTGDVILATPDQNPFSSLVALYLVAEGSGVRIKLPGRVDPNPTTGQLTATFENNPQLPFSALKVRFDGGENASLATPTACGRYETKTTVTSWSGKSVDLTSPMVIDQNCTSSPRGFSPGVNAGSVTPLAAKDSAFVLNLDRPDGQQNYADVGVKMPPGLLARISDIDLCAEANAAAGSCNDRSLIGTVQTTAGPGSAPLPVRGKAYLTGPYKGGPYGISIVVPTAGQAGPFDLGNVVVRAKIDVDRTDAHVTVTSDPMPTILRGFPLRIRQVQVAIDHGRFMLNPSSCKPMNVGVTVRGTEGGIKDSRVPYRVAGCGDLKQDQKISLAFTNKSQQRPGKHPGVEAKMTSKGPGVANLKKVVVKLPLSVALDPKNAKALCKPGQREAKACPKESIVGRASAKSVLKEELTGPVYFVEGTRVTKAGRVVPTLPKLWIPLSGGGVTIDVNADSDVSRKQLVSTFNDLPDAPITSFSMRLDSGKHGILTVPPSKEGGTCQRDKAVDMQLTGQNAAVKTVRSQVKVAGCKKKAAKTKNSAKPSKKRSAAKANSKSVPATRR